MKIFHVCPSMAAQTDCIVGWQSTFSSPEYLNTCDYLGGDVRPHVPLPIASGNGAIGFGAYPETVGTCLDNNLIAGETYDIGFYTGFNAALGFLSSLNVEIALFGLGSCDDMTDVHCNSSNWFEVASFNVVGSQDSSWVYFSSSFTTNVDVSAIAIGHGCNFLDTMSAINYHFIDEFRISGILGPVILVGEVPEISITGDCIDGIYLENDILDATSYQWYLNGEIVTDAITNPYEVASSDLGIYQVSSFDDLGCNLISAPLVVDTEIEVLDIDGEIIHLNCFFESVGSIDISVANQTNSPLTYAWSNETNSEDLQNLAAGTYTVTVTDTKGCFGVIDFTVESPDPMFTTIDIQQGSMGNPGSATVTATGGVLPYSYLWSNGNTTNSDDNLSAGFYSITVTDENGCEDILEFEITSDFLVDALATEISCFGSCNSTITLIVDGPDAAYSVVWDDATLDGFMPTNVCAGTYNYIVTDDTGSSFAGTIIILEPR